MNAGLIKDWYRKNYLGLHTSDDDPEIKNDEI